MSYQSWYDGLAHANGQPKMSGVFKADPADFLVVEDLGFEPTGDGEHWLISIRKTNVTTQYVLDRFHKFYKIPQRAIGYAGIKDRLSVSEQWFSIWDPTRLIEVEKFSDENIQVLRFERHQRKLKPGSLKGNRFEILLRNLHGDQADLDKRLDRTKIHGCPNYFGVQRFGMRFNNLDGFEAWVKKERQPKGWFEKGIWLSAARSFLFNQILSRRVKEQSWDKLLPGEQVVLNGSRSFFHADEITPELQRRLDEFDVHPSAPLAGKKMVLPTRDAGVIEGEELEPYRAWFDALVGKGVEATRRSLRLKPEALDWQWLDQKTLRIDLTLDSGSYATTVLRELLTFDEDV